ncbi:MAG: DNA polymerase III subunit gamma/tau [Elusimicrobiota bacterium]|jgi:DNA polymerase-3 subunit gamma/tau|nr:DNA polymerase III subunit gamma/tau [Elusimicrobiota bacterium]
MTKSYQVLARKYRPSKFEDVMGQDHICQILKNAIESGRIANAYLFNGPRGCGKTTMARIFAKALNCQNGPTAEPCGKCPNCIEISQGSSLDVIELDGASNRGIEEIRELRSNVNFAPANSKYKIYIIDEAHQITPAAFNALLKTLEEPPAHAVFIMATTEQHKFPITILSRCQRYRFRLLSSKDMTAVIKNIASKENFEIDDAALDIIISASGGSMRDALSLLDQVVASGASKIDAPLLRDILGVLSKETLTDTVDKISEGDVKGLIEIVESVVGEGFDVLQFAKDLRSYLRQMMIFSISPDILDISASDKKLFEAQKDIFTQTRFIRMNNLISKAIEQMHWHDQPQILLEMTLLKMAQDYYDIGSIVKKITELEKKFASQEPSAEPNAFAVKPPARQNPPDDDYQKPPQQNAQQPAAVPNFTPSDLKSVWQKALSEITNKNMLAMPLMDLAFTQEADKIILTASNNFILETAAKFKDQLKTLISDYANKTVELEIILKSLMPKAAAPQTNANFSQQTQSDQTQVNDENADDIAVEKTDEALVLDEAERPEQNLIDDVPDNIKEMAQAFGGTAKKTGKK